MDDIDWKGALKWLGVVGAVLGILVWLFSPTDAVHNRKTRNGVRE